jgi:PST family polysaccharide transporter
MSRLSGVIAVVFTAFAPWITKAVFGPEYGDAAPVLQVHIWAAVAVFLGVASGQYLTNEGLQRITLYRTLLGLAANILLNVLLIPLYGALGAALATLISYFFSVFSMAIFRNARDHSLLMARALLLFPVRQKPFSL